MLYFKQKKLAKQSLSLKNKQKQEKSSLGMKRLNGFQIILSLFDILLQSKI